MAVLLRLEVVLVLEGVTSTRRLDLVLSLGAGLSFVTISVV